MEEMLRPSGDARERGRESCARASSSGVRPSAQIFADQLRDKTKWDSWPCNPRLRVTCACVCLSLDSHLLPPRATFLHNFVFYMRPLAAESVTSQPQPHFLSRRWMVQRDSQVNFYRHFLFFIMLGNNLRYIMCQLHVIMTLEWCDKHIIKFMK